MKTKAYTDLVQSKKLAEILPVESADMCYEFDWDLDMNTKYKSTPIIIEESNHFELYSQDIPCWSLAALLRLFTAPLLQQDIGGKWLIKDWTGAFPKTETWYDNPIDACVKMILNLHEQKLI